MRTRKNYVGLYLNVCRSLKTNETSINDLVSTTGVSERSWYYALSDPSFLINIVYEIDRRVGYAKTDEKMYFYETLLYPIDRRAEKLLQATATEQQPSKIIQLDPYKDLRSAYYEDVNRLRTRFCKPSKNSNGQPYEVAESRIWQYNRPTPVKMKWLNKYGVIAVK